MERFWRIGDAEPREMEIIEDIMDLRVHGEYFSRCFNPLNQTLGAGNGGVKRDVFELFKAAMYWKEIARRKDLTDEALMNFGIVFTGARTEMGKQREVMYEFKVSDAYGKLLEECGGLLWCTDPDDDNPYILTDEDCSGQRRLIGKFLVNSGEDGRDTCKNAVKACYDSLMAVHLNGLSVGVEDGELGMWPCNDLASLWLLFARWMESEETMGKMLKASRLIEKRKITRFGEYCEAIRRDPQALADIGDEKFVAELKHTIQRMRERYWSAFDEALRLYDGALAAEHDKDGLRNGSQFLRFLEKNRPELAEWVSDNSEFAENLGLEIKGKLLERWEDTPSEEIVDEIKAACMGETPCGGRAAVIADMEWLDSFALSARPDWWACLADKENRKEIERFIERGKKSITADEGC